MNITNLADLKEAKEQLQIEVEKLHKDHFNRIVFSSNATGQKAVKKLYIIESLEVERDVKAAIRKITKINDSITDFCNTGKKRNNLSIPVYEKNIALVRIWINEAVSSRAITKDKLINCLTRNLDVTKRYFTPAHKSLGRIIESEIAYFENCDEHDFILRSVAEQDVTLRLYFEDMADAKIRLTTAGVFISAKDFNEPKILTPTPGKDGDARASFRSIFKGLDRVPYSGAPNALLFKKSDADKAKKDVNFNQNNIVESKKTDKKPLKN